MIVLSGMFSKRGDHSGAITMSERAKLRGGQGVRVKVTAAEFTMVAVDQDGAPGLCRQALCPPPDMPPA